MLPGTELYVITAPTEIAEQWLSCGQFSALIAVLHEISPKNICFRSALGRNHMHPKKPSLCMAVRVVSQKIFSVVSATAARMECDLRSLFAMTATRKRLVPNCSSQLPERA